MDYTQDQLLAASLDIQERRTVVCGLSLAAGLPAAAVWVQPLALAAAGISLAVFGFNFISEQMGGMKLKKLQAFNLSVSHLNKRTQPQRERIFARYAYDVEKLKAG